MSERMIELQRAKLVGTAQGTPTAKASPKSKLTGPPKTPQEEAKEIMLSEDKQMEVFIDRLQRRDDPPPSRTVVVRGGNAVSGPTVPRALSRRMIQRQGVGYLDGTVASVVSASADRFLATVLQQSIACRDQRLNGARLAKKAARDKKRHIIHYQADVEERKRRKEEIEKARETVALQAIQFGEAVKKENQSKASAASAAATAAAKANGETTTTTTTTKKKRKPPSGLSTSTKGIRIDPELKRLADQNPDLEGYDSIDEEEEYYQKHMGGLENGDDGNSGNNDYDDDDIKGKNGKRKNRKGKNNDDDDDENEDEEDDDEEDDDDEDDDEDEEDVALLLRDIVRPLEAWDFRVAGKETYPTQPDPPRKEEEDEEDDIGNGDIDDNEQDLTQPTSMDEGDDTDRNSEADGTKRSSSDGGGDKKPPPPTPPANGS